MNDKKKRQDELKAREVELKAREIQRLEEEIAMQKAKYDKLGKKEYDRLYKRKVSKSDCMEKIMDSLESEVNYRYTEDEIDTIYREALYRVEEEAMCLTEEEALELYEDIAYYEIPYAGENELYVTLEDILYNAGLLDIVEED